MGAAMGNSYSVVDRARKSKDVSMAMDDRRPCHHSLYACLGGVGGGNNTGQQRVNRGSTGRVV